MIVKVEFISVGAELLLSLESCDDPDSVDIIINDQTVTGKIEEIKLVLRKLKAK